MQTVMQGIIYELLKLIGKQLNLEHYGAEMAVTIASTADKGKQ